MREEIFSVEFTEIDTYVKQHQRFLILGHVDPDGDCIGSMLALTLFLVSHGKNVMCYAPGQIADGYMKLPGSDLFATVDDLHNFQYEVVFALDSPTTARTADIIKPGDSKPVINIDHHPTNEHYGRINVVDQNASATAVLIYRLLSAIANEGITTEMAACLYLGILLDTGGFRFQNTDAEALATAAELIRLGAQPYDLAHEFIYMKSFNTLKLLARALKSLELHCSGRVAFMSVSMKMVEESGGSISDTEGFIDYASSIDNVELSALFRELRECEVRVSLRSRNDYNVAELAEQYHGGGHRNAAGLMLHENLETARSIILRECKKLLKVH